MSYETFLFLGRLVFPIIVQFIAIIFGIKAVKTIKKNNGRFKKEDQYNRFIAIAALCSSICALIAILNFEVPEPEIFIVDNDTQGYNEEYNIEIKNTDILENYYTTNGEDPKNGTKYMYPFKVNNSTLVLGKSKFLWWWSKTAQLNVSEVTEYPIFTDDIYDYQSYAFTIPEETNYDNIKDLNNYVRLRDDYGRIFAVATCLYTDVNYDIDKIVLTGNDGSSFTYNIHDLILETPYITPQWTEQDIIQYITELTKGSMKDIEIINFSTTNTSYYVRGLDSADENTLVYLMVVLSHTVYRYIEIKMPYYKSYDDEVAKEYYAECIYRLSDFIDAPEKVRTYKEFYKYYKYH